MIERECFECGERGYVEHWENYVWRILFTEEVERKEIVENYPLIHKGYWYICQGCLQSWIIENPECIKRVERLN